MLQILTVALLSLLSGALLASGLLHALPLRPGWIGLAALLVSAWAARRYWQSPQRRNAPGSPERALWHGLASYGLVAGHLACALWRIGPQMDMHSLAGHALGVDSWTLVLGALISYRIARDPEPRQDERDALFAAHGLRAGHATLVAMLVLLLLALGFGEHTPIAQLNHQLLANLLILLLTLQCMVQQAVPLHFYAQDARHEVAA